MDFELIFSEWMPTDEGNSMIIYCQAYLGEQFIVEVPGRVTVREFKQHDPKLFQSLYENLRTLTIDTAQAQLGYGPLV